MTYTAVLASGKEIKVPKTIKNSYEYFDTYGFSALVMRVQRTTAYKNACKDYEDNIVGFINDDTGEYTTTF